MLEAVAGVPKGLAVYRDESGKKRPPVTVVARLTEVEFSALGTEEIADTRTSKARSDMR
jgi:hypothetical protein